MFISRLVGIACQAIGRKYVWKRLDSWSGDVAKAGARRMETINATYVPMSVNFTEEKYVGVNTLLNLLDDSKTLNESLRSAKRAIDDTNPNDQQKEEPEPDPMEMQVRRQLLFFVYPKRAIVRNYKTYMDAMIARANRPYAARGAEPKTPPDPITQIIAPVFSGGDIKDDSEKTQNVLLTVALALQAYKAERGAYPENLNELCPAYLTSLPADPFSAYGAAPPLYRRTPDKYVLYSIGPDGKDEGGKIIENAGRPNATGPRSSVRPQSKGDIVAWENQS